jgi:toxin-antitoxin system PIN domain toxin
VIIPDVNLLLYAVDDTAPHHARARAWWLGVLGGTEPVGLPWVTTLAFVRLSTNRRIFDSPLSADQALDLLQGWLAVPHVVALEPAGGHLDRVRGLLHELGTAANLVPDAHLAALAIGHRATLASADADFGRFPGLRWVNPLTG